MIKGGRRDTKQDEAIEELMDYTKTDKKGKHTLKHFSGFSQGGVHEKKPAVEKQEKILPVEVEVEEEEDLEKDNELGPQEEVEKVTLKKKVRKVVCTDGQIRKREYVVRIFKGTDCEFRYSSVEEIRQSFKNVKKKTKSAICKLYFQDLYKREITNFNDIVKTFTAPIQEEVPLR